MNKTYGEVLERHHVEIPDHLLADAEVPVLTGLQRQGDVLLMPAKPSVAQGRPVPPEGVAVVRGEAGGNTHLLVADGPVAWRPAAQDDDQTLGVIDVGADSTAYLLHPEHGANALGPGTYRAVRQREQADEIRLVSD